MALVSVVTTPKDAYDIASKVEISPKSFRGDYSLYRNSSALKSNFINGGYNGS